jgi:predicted O-methyltransferase YrrM
LLGKVVKGWNATWCWLRYLFLGARNGVPGLVDFVLGNHFFSAWQEPSELTGLGEILAARRPERALEIGTARGGTLLFLTRLASPQATIVSVDLPGGEFGGGYSRSRAWLYKRFARRKQRLELFQGDSHSRDMLDRVKAALRGQELDYLFIDGDHSYPGVKCDFEMYGPMVGNGGLIAFHDIVPLPENVGGVPQLWREIKSKHRHIEIINDRQQGGFGIGVLYVDEQSPVEPIVNTS